MFCEVNKCIETHHNSLVIKTVVQLKHNEVLGDGLETMEIAIKLYEAH